MPETETVFDALRQAARDLDITLVAGRLGPPDAGQMWIGTQSLDELLLRDRSGRRVALLIAPGGTEHDVILSGTGVLNARDVERLNELAATASGNVYQGVLELMNPEKWLERHPAAAQQAREQVPTSIAAQQDNRDEGAEIRGADHGPTIDRAVAAGWPDNLGDYPALFLDDRPIYHLLAEQNIGRTVTLLIGALAAS